jgi:hypothetical protein
MIPTWKTTHTCRGVRLSAESARRAPCPAVGAIQEAIRGVVDELRRIQDRIAELCATCGLSSRAASSGSPRRGGSAAAMPSSPSRRSPRPAARARRTSPGPHPRKRQPSIQLTTRAGGHPEVAESAASRPRHSSHTEKTR